MILELRYHAAWHIAECPQNLNPTIQRACGTRNAAEGTRTLNSWSSLVSPRFGSATKSFITSYTTRSIVHSHVLNGSNFHHDWYLPFPLKVCIYLSHQVLQAGAVVLQVLIVVLPVLQSLLVVPAVVLVSNGNHSQHYHRICIYLSHQVLQADAVVLQVLIVIPVLQSLLVVPAVL